MAISYPSKYFLGSNIPNPRVYYITIKEIIDEVNALIDGSISTTNLTLTGTLTVDTVSEYTAAAGVTLDGVRLKDGAIRALDTTAVVSADGAISVPEGNTTYFITKAGVAAMTLTDPTAGTHDGLRLTFISVTAQAHTLTNGTGTGFNSGGAGADVGTFGGARGDGITLVAYNGAWYVVDKTNVTLA